MSKKRHSGDLPPPVTERSSRAELWEELCAANAEIDDQRQRLYDQREEAAKAQAEIASLRAKLAGAYLRLNVIQAALSHHDAA